MTVLRQYSIVLFIFILILFTSNSVNAQASNEEYPEFIPLLQAPCCLECSYTLPYCYNYNISNMDEGIKVLEWKFDDGWINGSAAASIDAKLIIKMCFQLSLSAAYILLDEEMDLDAEFDFKVKISSIDNSKGRCIDKTQSEIDYKSFVLQGNLAADPIPEIGNQLVEDIAYVIETSVYKAAHDLINSNVSSENDENSNILCDQPQDDSRAIESPCPCY